MRTVLWTLLEVMRCVGILMQPLTPQAASRMLDQLGIDQSPSGQVAGSATAAPADARGFAAISPVHAIKAGVVLPLPAPVFPRIEVDEPEPLSASPAAPPTRDDSWLESITDIESAVQQQGELVRSLKAVKADKADIAVEVDKLVKLKSRLAAPSK
jgi:hypothetical protein